MSTTTPLVVFSHLRWEFVYQRPQHLLTRLAAKRPVFYIEEPLPSGAEAPHWRIQVVAPNVTVCQPITPEAAPGFCQAQLPGLQTLLTELTEQHGLRGAIVWLYTPMALPLVDTLAPCALAYDCMDELSLFDGAPPELHAFESELLTRADVVFTGGQSLYRAKHGRNPHLFCFPSSVEAEHFGASRPGAASALPEPAAQRDLPQPRLGYYGVIDERLDLNLLAGLALARPEWQIVMVGPVVKIDPATLPRYPNLHYLGQQAYADLPNYLAGWDVCLMPFARNASTRYISPTKTLEYMAAERMIASTPIADVAAAYSDIVFIGDSVGGFVNACERALQLSPTEREIRVRRMRAVLTRTSWQATAAAIDFQLRQAVERRLGVEPMPVPVMVRHRASAALPSSLTMD